MATKVARREDFVGTGPVRYRIEGPSEAPTGASIKIDYTDAPVPEHYYVADYFYAADLGFQALLAFGKWEDAGQKEKLRNKLEIYFPAAFFLSQLWKSRRDFHKTLRGLVVKHGFSAAEAGSPDTKAEKTQTIHSNNVLMVLSGGECMMDFFYLSPRDMYLRIRKRKPLALEPLVRVIISPTHLLGFLDACEPIAASLATKFPSEGENDDDSESR